MSFKQEIKKLWKFFLIFFLISFFAINWNEVSWLFNFNFIQRGISSFFSKTNADSISMSDQKNRELKELKEYQYTEKEDSIEISKIGIEAPLVFSQSDSESDMEAALKKGVVHYPKSPLPGEKGTATILGHSAPLGWPKINFDWVFNDLNNLEVGDEIVVNYNHAKYIFKVSQKTILERGVDLPLDWLSEDKEKLVLLSCWPPGKNLKRVAILATLDK